MQSYKVIENCHYQGVTYRIGQRVKLPEDPHWPERFKSVGDEAAPAAETQAEATAAQTKAKK